MFCPKCSSNIADGAKFCNRCGAEIRVSSAPLQQSNTVNNNMSTYAGKSDRDWLTVFFLCWILGVFGVHRFYTGKYGTGLLWFFTWGLGGIGVIYDVVMIVTNQFYDSQGRLIDRFISNK